MDELQAGGFAINVDQGIEDIVAIEDQGIRAYVPVSEAGHRSGRFRDTDFVSDTAADSDRCPAGEILRFLSLC